MAQYHLIHFSASLSCYLYTYTLQSCHYPILSLSNTLMLHLVVELHQVSLGIPLWAMTNPKQNKTLKLNISTCPSPEPYWDAWILSKTLKYRSTYWLVLAQILIIRWVFCGQDNLFLHCISWNRLASCSFLPHTNSTQRKKFILTQILLNCLFVYTDSCNLPHFPSPWLKWSLSPALKQPGSLPLYCASSGVKL